LEIWRASSYEPPSQFFSSVGRAGEGGLLRPGREDVEVKTAEGAADAVFPALPLAALAFEMGKLAVVTADSLRRSGMGERVGEYETG
jgi:hypothetical protein